MGSLDHGIAIIKTLGKIKSEFPFQFGFKLQYRDLDTFIHPDYQNRQDIKYVKRFSETRLSREQLKILKDEITHNGFISICTPFDENSVGLIEEHDFDVIKIGSCSFTDWPLLERIAQTHKPIIASTAGALLEDIDKVVSFFEHREKVFALMHCVGVYPTQAKDLELNQIDLLKTRYPAIPIGFSTHEEPANFDPIKMAIAKDAKLFERHVGIENATYQLNAYSSSPEQVRQWLKAAELAYEACGVSGRRRDITKKEEADLRGLRRGVFAKADLTEGSKISPDNVFYAIPNIDSQLVANESSKYVEYRLKKAIKKNGPITRDDVETLDLRAAVLTIINKVNQVLLASKIALPNRVEFELSHHYGIERYEEYGAAIINCINREYCKKLIILLPGQKHPSHYHQKKEETFHVLFGEMTVELDGKERKIKAGEMVIVERGVGHSFKTDSGVIFEEVSTTHYPNDSFYQDKKILENKNRKTQMTYWADWIHKPIQ